MSLNFISQEFRAAFAQKKCFRPTAAPDRPIQYTHTFYPLKCLYELSEQVKKKADKEGPYDCLDHDFLSNYAARFVVAKDGEILFSLEGARSRFIPAHSDIIPTVLTAGNIIFSQDYSKIAQITNKSGHFKPSFGSLVFAIPLILSSEFPLAESITLSDEVIKAEGEFENRKEEGEFVFTVNELASSIPTVDKSILLESNKAFEVIISSNLRDTADEMCTSSSSPNRKRYRSSDFSEHASFFSSVTSSRADSNEFGSSIPQEGEDHHLTGYNTP